MDRLFFGFQWVANRLEDNIPATQSQETSDSGVALENTASVSGMLLTTECVITQVKSAEPAMPMGGGMPGMMY